MSPSANCKLIIIIDNQERNKMKLRIMFKNFNTFPFNLNKFEYLVKGKEMKVSYLFTLKIPQKMRLNFVVTNLNLTSEN